jgi:hypothetical protein
LKDRYAKYQWLGFEILGLDSETLGQDDADAYASSTIAITRARLSIAKTRSPLLSTTWEMGCNVVEQGYMRPRRGILESDDILSKGRAARPPPRFICLGLTADGSDAISYFYASDRRL